MISNHETNDIVAWSATTYTIYWLKRITWHFIIVELPIAAEGHYNDAGFLCSIKMMHV